MLQQLALDGLASNSIRCCRCPSCHAADPGPHLPTARRARKASPQPVRAQTEVIRKGKLGKPNQFGNMVKLQEAENQIVIDMRSTIGGRATRIC